MIWWLGWTCVAWTIAELIRMGLTPSEGPQIARTQASAGMRPTCRRFAAWDEGGRPIVVEDLGRVR